MFLSDYMSPVSFDEKSLQLKRAIKIRDEYGTVMNMPKEVRTKSNGVKSYDEEISSNEANKEIDKQRQQQDQHENEDNDEEMIEQQQINAQYHANDLQSQSILPTFQSTSIVNEFNSGAKSQQSKAIVLFNEQQKALAPKRALISMPKPQWHAPWKLYRVISGHLGWVRCVDVEPGNEWFATGSGDRLIKIWDLASGTLKLSLTGHISAVRGLAISSRHPYLFSCGEDKQVKCWDLEQNKVIRHYHGHLSACYALSLHPTLDILVSAGRDTVARVSFTYIDSFRCSFKCFFLFYQGMGYEN